MFYLTNCEKLRIPKKIYPILQEIFFTMAEQEGCCCMSHDSYPRNVVTMKFGNLAKYKRLTKANKTEEYIEEGWVW